MHLTPTTLCAAGLAGIVLTTTAPAQWSSDPAVNLAIGDVAAADTQAKVAATSDGGCYISWFSGSGFDVRLQRLDAAGVEQWAHNGILIADRGFSSTQDYDLSVDADDNALVAFRDDRFTGIQVTAQKVAPDGSTPWGANGLQFDDGSGFIGIMRITATTDGSVCVGWSHDNETRVHKVAADGTPAWATATVLPLAENTTLISDMQASNDGSVILSAVGYVTFNSAKHLYAMRVAADGTLAWKDWTSVMDNNSLQFGNFPAFVSDGAGGGVFSWYSTGSGLQCWVQRVLADGSEVFTDNGVAVSTAAGDRTGPSVAYNPSTEECFVFWPEQFGPQYAIYGQKLNAAGARQWTDSGVEVSPFSMNVVGGVRTHADGCGATVFFGEELAFGNDRIRGARLDADGNAVWTPSIVTPGAAATGKSRLVSDTAADGGAILAWVDLASGDDVYAQRVNLDGSLGMAPADGDATGDGIVDFDDLLLVLSKWGPCCGCPADLNNDGVVDFDDLLLVLSNWD